LAQFTQLINGAFKNYQSVLALARSPLADSALVHPLLVLDDVSPTADERGHALRLVLQWAVSRLAPGPIAHPLGSERPYDDPTWRDPRWWRYNILRHRYLEPLHPDEFVDGGRFTETLLALTGITSADAFFDERNRAIREVAQRLQEQLRHGEANDELQTLALDEVLRPLQGSPEQEELLGIAATFDDVFPRHLLLQMARAERLSAADHLLDELTARRFLLMGDGGTNLWLSPVLQHHVYSRQPAAKIRSRHLAVAAYYRRQEEPLKAAEHLQQAENWAAAAQLLLSATEELVNDLQTDELLAALTRFKADQLEATTWCAVQLICCDLYRRHGQPEAALTVCRHALRTTTAPSQQGQLYWRMGKLYEKRNQPQALGYYERALSSFAEEDPARIALLKDRAWLYLLRREWMAAQTDLHRALALIDLQVTAPRTTQLGTLLTGMQSIIELHANVLDALAHLHLEQSHFSAAIDYAQRALHLREEAGDLLQVAKSFNNLGNFYSRMGEVNAAVAAHDEAIQLYQRLNNLELEAEAWLNRGAVYHTAGRQRDAIENYHKSLALSQQLNLLWAEVTAHANLTEAHAELDELKAAQRHWHYGHELSRQAAFADDIAYFVELRERFDL
ncbi:MAG: tetratricopeptide repeat protein, partial [Caldilineaceae bacterium]|nr:tetratricopeptide repeat protein [Caldilineaceae bacterium]